jgi:hypothetical protein
VDVKLFKPGQVQGHEWTDRWKDRVADTIQTWQTNDRRTIRVTEGYTGNFLEFQVRRFTPQEGDKLTRTWVTNGVSKSVEIPPYAIIDMEVAKAALEEYIETGAVNCCRGMLGGEEDFLWRTYSYAIRRMDDPLVPERERELLKTSLKLWMSIRLTTKSFEIVGQDILGMNRDIINDKSNPLHGKIPLPPVMGAQIDSVLIHKIQPELRRKTLEELQRMTQDKKLRSWMTTYLVSFILLHNIGLITKHDAEYARKHGMKVRFL